MSKGCVSPSEDEGFNVQDLVNEIFAGFDDFAKRLMAVLICETIRYGDSWACVRVDMRETIYWHEYMPIKFR